MNQDTLKYKEKIEGLLQNCRFSNNGFLKNTLKSIENGKEITQSLMTEIEGMINPDIPYLRNGFISNINNSKLIGDSFKYKDIYVSLNDLIEVPELIYLHDNYEYYFMYKGNCILVHIDNFNVKIAKYYANIHNFYLTQTHFNRRADVFSVLEEYFDNVDNLLVYHSNFIHKKYVILVFDEDDIYIVNHDNYNKEYSKTKIDEVPEHYKLFESCLDKYTQQKIDYYKGVRNHEKTMV